MIQTISAHARIDAPGKLTVLSPQSINEASTRQADQPYLQEAQDLFAQSHDFLNTVKALDNQGVDLNREAGGVVTLKSQGGPADLEWNDTFGLHAQGVELGGTTRGVVWDNAVGWGVGPLGDDNQTFFNYDKNLGLLTVMINHP